MSRSVFKPHRRSQSGQALLETLALMTAFAAASAVYANVASVTQSAQRRVAMAEAKTQIDSTLVNGGILARGSTNNECTALVGTSLLAPITSLTYPGPGGATQTIAVDDLVNGKKLDSIRVIPSGPISAGVAQSGVVSNLVLKFSDPSNSASQFEIVRTLQVDVNASGGIDGCRSINPKNDIQNLACNSILSPMDATLASDCRNTGTMLFIVSNIVKNICLGFGAPATYTITAGNTSNAGWATQMSDAVNCGGLAVFDPSAVGVAPAPYSTNPLQTYYSRSEPFVSESESEATITSNQGEMPPVNISGMIVLSPPPQEAVAVEPVAEAEVDDGSSLPDVE